MPYLDHLLKPKPKQVIRHKVRDQVIHQLIDIMDDWRNSPFEFEGACFHGLRAALCLEGHSYGVAEYTAYDLVQSALKRLGAVRPSWIEGQREYTTSRENCAWCGVPIPESDLNTRRALKFCSGVCSRSALQHWSFETHKWQDKRAQAAFRLIYKEKNDPIKCTHCGDLFKPNRKNNGQKFCSQRCKIGSQAIRPTVCCDICGAAFVHKYVKKAGKYCSRECYYKSKKGKPMRNRVAMVPRLTPDRFDNVWLMAA